MFAIARANVFSEARSGIRQVGKRDQRPIPGVVQIMSFYDYPEC
jgi:hypothetical protein